MIPLHPEENYFNERLEDAITGTLERKTRLMERQQWNDNELESLKINSE